MLDITLESIILTVINLLILLIALRIFLFKPVWKVIEARRKEADRQFEEVKKKNEEAQTLKRQYEESLLGIEEQLRQEMKTTREDADKQYRRIVGEAKEQAENIKKKATAQAQAQREQILKSTEKELAGIIVDAATKVIGKESGENIDSALYDEFLGKAGE